MDDTARDLLHHGWLNEDFCQHWKPHLEPHCLDQVREFNTNTESNKKWTDLDL